MSAEEELIDTVGRATMEGGIGAETGYITSWAATGAEGAAVVRPAAGLPTRGPAGLSESVLGSVPGPKDVLCGKDSTAYGHVGNHHFRALIAMNSEKYARAPRRSDRTHLTCSIVSKIIESGGRFVKKNPLTGEYEVLSVLRAREKVSHALRDVRRFAGKGRIQKATRRQIPKRPRHSPFLGLVGTQRPLGKSSDKPMTSNDGVASGPQRAVSWDDTGVHRGSTAAGRSQPLSRNSILVSPSLVSENATSLAPAAALAKPSFLDAVLAENLLLKRQLQKQQAAKDYIKQVVSEELMNDLRSPFQLHAPSRHSTLPPSSINSAEDYALYPAIRNATPSNPPSMPSRAESKLSPQSSLAAPETKKGGTDESPKSLSPFLLALAENELANMKHKN